MRVKEFDCEMKSLVNYIEPKNNREYPYEIYKISFFSDYNPPCKDDNQKDSRNEKTPKKRKSFFKQKRLGFYDTYKYHCRRKLPLGMSLRFG
jgi:hypothetical protein